MIKLYNTLTRRKENFKPQKSTVTYYTCGPTVYDRAHIGNLRTFIFEDVLRRTLEYAGYRVKQAMNITDVEDKIIKLYKEKKSKDITEITAPITKSFLKDLDKLNIEGAEEYPTVTGNIETIIDIVEKLLEKGYAYVGKDKSVYFDIAKFKKYGELARLKKVDLRHGARISSDEYEKEQIGDFVLWKAKRAGEPSWPSPFGEGRPGWHIECSVLSMKYLGPTIDIHAGGVDLIFPHHTNEIAQSEAATGKQFVRFWIHGEHLLVDGKKMAKSAKNFYTVDDIEKKGFSPLAFRYLTLTAHYKTKLNFTWKGIASSERALDNLRKEFARLEFLSKKDKRTSSAGETKQYKKMFLEAISDDLNMPKALSVAWGAVNDTKLTPRGKTALLQDFDKVLGLNLAAKPPKPQADVVKMVQEREKFRTNKQFTKADALRGKVEKLGYIIEDTPQGPFIWREKNN